ncbi:MAG: PAS domain-containing protein, partial [Spirochaetota bacterium]
MAETKTELSNLILNIIEGVSDGILIQNDNGEILFFNDKLLELTGWNSYYVLFNQQEIKSKLQIEEE